MIQKFKISSQNYSLWNADDTDLADLHGFSFSRSDEKKNFEIMESLNHGIFESWNHGIMESWNH